MIELKSDVQCDGCLSVFLHLSAWLVVLNYDPVSVVNVYEL